MKKSKKILLVLCSAFIAVFSLCFCFLGNNDTLQVKADTVSSNYEYVGNELFYLSTFVVSDGSIDPQVKTIVFDLTLSYGKLISGYTALYTNSYIFDTNTVGQTPYNLFFSLWDDINPSTPQVNANSSDRKKLRIQNFSTSYWIPVYFKTVGAFNCDVVSVTLETVSANSTNAIFTDWTYFLNSNYKIIQLTYTDSDENTFVMQLFTLSSVTLTQRTYYIKPDFSDNQIYNDGYQQGLLDNQTNIYNDGYSAGKTIGYSNGYNAGLTSGSNYTFFGLISAVVDAPIKAFYGLFNFNLMGVNLAGFVQALLTLAIVIFIIRFALQR